MWSRLQRRERPSLACSHPLHWSTASSPERSGALGCQSSLLVGHSRPVAASAGLAGVYASAEHIPHGPRFAVLEVPGTTSVPSAAYLPVVSRFLALTFPKDIRCHSLYTLHGG